MLEFILWSWLFLLIMCIHFAICHYYNTKYIKQLYDQIDNHIDREIHLQNRIHQLMKEKYNDN